MNYIDFRNRMFDLACFSVDQVFAWQPGFDRNNLSRWVGKGLLVRLRRGWFTFPDYRGRPDFARYFANRIYHPSCISLHSALSFYGMIPEEVVQVTNVTTLKTASFSSPLGEFVYKSVRNELMFGYDLLPMADGRVFRIASREKALLDLLYLYPEYKTVDDMLNLRLDEETIHDDLNRDRFDEYAARFNNRALASRIQKLNKAYGL